MVPELLIEPPHASSRLLGRFPSVSVAVVVSIVLLSGPGLAQGSNEAAEARTSDEVPATESVATEADRYEVHWTVVEGPKILEMDDLPVALAAGPDGYLLAHNCHDGCLGLLSSPDGVVWDEHAIDGPGDRIIDLAWAEGAFHALVRDGVPPTQRGPAAKWFVYSSMDGREWRRVRVVKTRKPDRLNAVAAGPQDVVVAGCTGIKARAGFGDVLGGPLTDCKQGVIWAMADDGGWSRTEPNSARNAELADIARFDGGLTAVGDRAMPEGKQPASIVLTQADGEAWERAKVDLTGGVRAGSITADPNGGLLVQAACCFRDGFMDDRGGILLASDDGRRWERLDDVLGPPDRRGPRSFASGVATNDGFDVAVGASYPPRGPGIYTIWWADDDGWRRRSLSRNLGGRWDLVAIGPGGHVVVVQSPTIWVGELRERPIGDEASRRPEVGPVTDLVSVPVPPRSTPARQAVLYAHASDAGRCTPLGRKRLGAAAPEATAGIRCTDRRDDIESVQHALFVDEDALWDWWSRRLGEGEDVATDPGDGALSRCATGESGEGAWASSDGGASGRVACYRDGADTWQLAWANPDRLIGSWATVTSDDYAGIARWFAAGRVEAPTVPAAPEMAPGIDYAEREAVAEVESSSRRELEEKLMVRLSPIECRPWRRDDEPFAFGASAAIRCGDPGLGVSQAALFQFPDSSSLAAYWSERTGNLGLEPRARACASGRSGTTRWEHGDMACYAAPPDGVPKIRWTDERSGNYGVLDGTSTHWDVPTLHRWWRDNIAPEPSATPATAPSARPIAAPRAPRQRSPFRAWAWARPAGSGGNATWRDRADDEDGYRVYARHIWTTPACEERRGKFRRIATLAPDTQRYRPVHRQVIRQLPQRKNVWKDRDGESPVAYEIHVAAFNEAGESKRVEAGSYSFGLFECGFDV